MSVFCIKRVLCLVTLLLLIGISVQAQEASSIVINLPSRTLDLYVDNNLVKEYGVAIGKPATPTPQGDFKIIHMEVNPTWVPPGRGNMVPSGPNNPLGYRWMGFYADYGIHGTNAPWSIGTAASNGCVRMLESDVEELFERVNYGTPVRINYDRIKINIDNHGQASIGIYPDVYGCQQLGVGDVYSKLASYGLNGLVNDEFIRQIISEEAGTQKTLGQVYNIKINDKRINQRAFYVDGDMRVPVWAIASAFKTNIVWDEQNQLVYKEKQKVRGTVKGDIIYVAPENIQKLFGGQYEIKPEEHCIEYNVITTLLNNKAITTESQVVNNVLAIPANKLAAALGKKATVDLEKNIVIVQGKNIPVSIINNQPYIKINQINEYFNLAVYWNQTEHTIELSYAK